MQTRCALHTAWPKHSWAQFFTSTSVAWPESITQSGDYEYRVRACRQVSGHEVCSGWKHSPVISYLAPASDPSVRVMAANEEGGSATEAYFSTNGQYFVAWDAITYATHYELEENSAPVSAQAGTSWECARSEERRA